MKRFEDNLTEKIYDNVHGFIYLTKQEKLLLSTPYFQRLNHIKQLGLSYVVFPGAVHTRFSHSLGVLHITEKLIQRLKRRRKTYRKLFQDKKNHQIARLAALLHDIGHYPLSHTLESSYKECSNYLDLIDKKNEENKKLKGIMDSERETEREEANNENKDIISRFKDKLNKGKLQDFFNYDKEIKNLELEKYHHEKMARTVIKSPIFKNLIINYFDTFNFTSTDIDLICSIIDGTNQNEEFFIISKLIKSNFDADQMDYMLRDTKNTGINASIDLDFIIDNMTVLPRDYKSLGYKNFICFSNTALPAIEQFLLSKYYWYSNILYYDKAYIINYMARRLYSYLLMNDDLNEFNTIKKIETSLEVPEEFFFFNDNYFWNQIFKIIQNSSKYPSLVVKLAKMLVNRDFPELIKKIDFDKKIRSKYKFVNFDPIIEIEQSQLTNEINQFRYDFISEAEKNLLPIPIDREIVKVGSEEIGEDAGKTNEKLLNKDEKQRRDLNLYLANEDICITNNLTTCRVIHRLHNKQFLNLFFEGKQPKKLYMFRIYDFNKCLSKN